MAPLIRIGSLDAVEAAQLADALAVRGLVARVSRSGKTRSVEIHHPHEELVDLLPDLVSALDSWLLDSGREQLGLTVGREKLVVTRSDDLPAVLRARIRQAPRQAPR